MKTIKMTRSEIDARRELFCQQIGEASLPLIRIVHAMDHSMAMKRKIVDRLSEVFWQSARVGLELYSDYIWETGIVHDPTDPEHPDNIRSNQWKINYLTRQTSAPSSETVLIDSIVSQLIELHSSSA